MAGTTLEAEIFGGAAEEDALPEEFKTMSADDINRRCVGQGWAGAGSVAGHGGPIWGGSATAQAGQAGAGRRALGPSSAGPLTAAGRAC